MRYDQMRAMLKIWLGTVLIFLVLAPAMAAEYPTKPIMLIVPFGAGSAPDTTFRILAGQAEKDLAQKVVILNRPGAGGTIGARAVALAAPDGYTIGMSAVAILVLQPLLKDLPYEGPDDFTLVVQTNEAPTALAVNFDSPWRKLNDFLAEARRREGQVSVGLGGGLYSVLHVALALLEKSAGVRFNVVPFEGNAHLTALLGGFVDAAVAQTGLFGQHVKAGKMRVLGQFGSTRVKGYEDVPTFNEQGHAVTLIPYEFIIAPKGTPPAVVDRLAAAFKKAVEGQVFRDYADNRGLLVSYLGSQELSERLREDARLYRQIVKDLGWAKEN